MGQNSFSLMSSSTLFIQTEVVLILQFKYL